MRADLHLHSKHTGEAAEWLFRRIGMPGSYSEPAALYDKAKSRGMDFFTLTDLDTIDGCLSIAGKPGVFLSEEVTTQFPEDRVKLHLLVWGIDQSQHVEIQKLRESVYDLQQYLAAQGIAHAVAHPLHRRNDRFNIGHLEKLVLLFRHFEGVNGTRNALSSAVARHVFASLTPAKIEELAARHHLAPAIERAWEKCFVGGSNDRSGLFVGNAWTEAGGNEVRGFLDAVRAGQCTAGGNDGNPLGDAHGLYGSMFQFASQKFAGVNASGLVGKAFSRFMEGENPTEFSLGEKLGFLAHGIVTGKIFELAKPRRASIWKQFATTFRDADIKETLARLTAGVSEPERRSFITACLFADRLMYQLFTAFVKNLSGGNLMDALQSATMMVPVTLALAPYFAAFRRLAPDRAWLGAVSRAFTGADAPMLANHKRAWFTDTLEDVNGVATTIKRMSTAATENGDSLIVVTSRAGSTLTGIPLKNFEPIGEFELPEYELQKLSFPPVLQMIDYLQREGFTELIISTPGPVGLTALLAARVLGIRTAGIYHTDFPEYVRILTDDSSWETLTWVFMRWFYSQMDTVWVNSEAYRQSWIARGLPAERMHILPRGLDTQLFSASRREATFWQSRGASAGAVVLLFVGRISKEKNLDVLVDAWRQLRTDDVPLALALVGDGPYLPELRKLLPDAIFTGYLAGEQLATAFASADVFVFPSVTDTFGNVVIEAQSCGLPCVVTDVGGPKDLVESGVTGHIARGSDAKDFARAIALITADAERRKAMREACIQSVAGRNWREAAKRWWNTTS